MDGLIKKKFQGQKLYNLKKMSFRAKNEWIAEKRLVLGPKNKQWMD